MGLLSSARGMAKKGAKRVVSKVLGRVLGPADDDPYGTYGGKDPDELTRVYKEMSQQGGEVAAGSTVRPRASKTQGARFGHYPILEEPAEGRWDLAPGLREPVKDGRGLAGKEALFLAIVPSGPEGERLEEQLAVLHPHLDPKYVVVIARAKGADVKALWLGTSEVSPPRLPLILAFELPDDHTLAFKAASVGPAEDHELRAVLIDTILRGSPRGPMAGGVVAQLMGHVVDLG